MKTVLMIFCLFIHVYTCLCNVGCSPKQIYARSCSLFPTELPNLSCEFSFVELLQLRYHIPISPHNCNCERNCIPFLANNCKCNCKLWVSARHNCNHNCKWWVIARHNSKYNCKWWFQAATTATAITTAYTCLTTAYNCNCMRLHAFQTTYPCLGYWLVNY